MIVIHTVQLPGRASHGLPGTSVRDQPTLAILDELIEGGASKNVLSPRTLPSRCHRHLRIILDGKQEEEQHVHKGYQVNIVLSWLIFQVRGQEHKASIRGQALAILPV
uniref:Uncharacterized protein n=1 Tax=Steinernema glaseri TaxID=37863 RepID=A0A1I7YRT1_9BILA